MTLYEHAVFAIGLFSSVLGIYSTFKKEIKSKIMLHSIYGLVICTTSIVATLYISKIKRIESAERAASRLIRNVEFEYTNEGFIHASLAFLEKNKELFPDAYSRALDLCKQNSCLGSQNGANPTANPYDLINVKSALKGLLKGIAAIESDK